MSQTVVFWTVYVTERTCHMSATADDDNDNDWCVKVWYVKMCDIYGQAFTTKFQKCIWHIQTAGCNSAEYVPHV
jgi:hypothetical protein